MLPCQDQVDAQKIERTREGVVISLRVRASGVTCVVPVELGWLLASQEAAGMEDRCGREEGRGPSDYFTFFFFPKSPILSLDLIWQKPFEPAKHCLE